MRRWLLLLFGAKEVASPPVVVALTLSRASLCVNCEGIVETGKACPLCGSHVLLALSVVLNRDVGTMELEKVMYEMEKACAVPRKRGRK